MKFPDFIKTNVPLADYSTLGVGGRADYFVQIDSLPRCMATYNFARENQLDILVLGRGSNILFSDRGFGGLVMHMNMRQLHYKFESDEFSADAGALVSKIVELGERLGFSGFESFAGLPGTVGGAIYGNAGCYGKQFWEIVELINYFDGHYFKQIPASPELYDYRWSFFKENPQCLIISAILKFEPSDNEVVVAGTKRIRKLRYANQPTQASVGCIFENPIVNGERVSAGLLIDQTGLKGTQIGQAMVSREHANFFVNLGGAKAGDFIELIKITKGCVLKESGVLLKEEIILVGEF